MNRRTTRLARWVAPFALCAAFGQTPDGKPAFEVASIKPGIPGSNQLRSVISAGGRLTAPNTSLRTLIEDAYQLKPFQLVGGQRWIDSEKFALNAKGDESATRDQVRLMFQNLLAERFQLVMHRESKEQPMYALMLKGGASKLRAAAAGDRQRMEIEVKGASTHLKFMNTSMATLANMLSRQMERMVVDETGLAGEFDFELDPSRDPSDPNPLLGQFAPALPQLGLRLESRRGSVEIFVIDSAQKPSEN